jgi:acyl-coenzyme A thioesterase PaaI-like protein
MDGVLGGHRAMLRARTGAQSRTVGGDVPRARNVFPPRPGGTVRAVLTPDPRPTSFDSHPGLRGREPEARDLADVLRRLIRLSVSTAPPAGETARLTAQLAALADELETHVPETPLPRFMAPDDDGPPKDVPLGGAMPYDVVVGPFNPVALPVVLDFEPPKALGRAVFDVAYEGAPGCVHGAVLAAVFDIILTAANAIEGSVGPTVRLAVRYLRPTLTDEEAVFEGWVTEVTDRRIFSKGRIVQGGTVTVEAEGEFAIFNQDGVKRMASSRRRSFDAGLRSSAGPGAEGSNAVPTGE